MPKYSVCIVSKVHREVAHAHCMHCVIPLVHMHTGSPAAFAFERGTLLKVYIAHREAANLRIPWAQSISHLLNFCSFLSRHCTLLHLHWIEDLVRQEEEPLSGHATVVET